MSNKTILTNNDESVFILSGWQTAEKMGPGFYNYDDGMFGVQFQKLGFSTERIQKISQSQNRLFQVINDFWGKKDRYLKMGVRHRTAIMMFGMPGTGKTVAMRKAIFDTIDAGGFALDMKDLSDFVAAVKAIKKFYPNAPILGCCEDMDSRFGDGSGGVNYRMEEAWTHLLDGVGNELDGVLIVATSNATKDNINRKFSERLLRPGRFDVKMEIHPPTRAERVSFIAELWDVPADHAEVVEIADATDGKVIAEIKSIAVRRYIDGLQEYKATAKPKKGKSKAAPAVDAPRPAMAAKSA